jgi:hypothetical protein
MESGLFLSCRQTGTVALTMALTVLAIAEPHLRLLSEIVEFLIPIRSCGELTAGRHPRMLRETTMRCFLCPMVAGTL